jgi:hypothetical protein
MVAEGGAGGEGDHKVSLERDVYIHGTMMKTRTEKKSGRGKRRHLHEAVLFATYPVIVECPPLEPGCRAALDGHQQSHKARECEFHLEKAYH